MGEPPRISEAEWEVMEVLWAESPRTAAEVAEALTPTRDWSPTTIKTMLARLLRKGALRHRRQGRRFLYSPAVSRETCSAAETENFVERVCGGSASPLLAWFVEQRGLSATEVEELQALIDASRDGRKP